MPEPVIRIQNVSKRYRIGKAQTPYRTLRDTIMETLKSPLRGLAGRSGGENPYIWALKDINLEIHQGETVGIIGRNGAGKSTLLKLLARITRPTEGRIEMRGRVGSLLEVGTGFSNELSGRENIYLNGAILGMRKKEIDRRFDEIVAFAEIEKFLDTPVKHYSSGMYMRLAFAVAAHLEPEILLVDEVLAVGDAEFQKKCLGKMGEVAQQGRTVLFVSHNMGAIGRLCNHGIVLHEGNNSFMGKIDQAIATYSQNVKTTIPEMIFMKDISKKIQFRKIALYDENAMITADIDREKEFKVVIELEVIERVTGAHIAFLIDRIDGIPICYSYDIDNNLEKVIEREIGIYRININFPGGLLNSGMYQLRFGIARQDGGVFDYKEPFVINLIDTGNFASQGGYGSQRQGVLAMCLDWEMHKIE